MHWRLNEGLPHWAMTPSIPSRPAQLSSRPASSEASSSGRRRQGSGRFCYPRAVRALHEPLRQVSSIPAWWPASGWS